MMQLTEWERSASTPMTPEVRRALEAIFQSTISSGDVSDEYVVRPGGVVGSVSVGGQEIVVQPKIAIDRVLFMVAYAKDPYGWQEKLSALGRVDSLVEGMMALFVQACSPLLAGGLLRDYRQIDVDDRVVRGKIRWSIQARRQTPIPIALRHHVHDDDILENRVLRAACQVLRRTTSSTDKVSGLNHVWGGLRDLSPLADPATACRKVLWTRRNLHYRPAVELARVILAGDMADLTLGEVPVSGFTLRMHDVFERFLRAALRAAWGVTEEEVPESWGGSGLHLDDRGEVDLSPDVGWRDRTGQWRFIAEAKYKKDPSGAGKSADIYQALAYATAAGLPEVTLVYGEGGPDQDHAMPRAQKAVRIRHVSLAAPPTDVLTQIRRIGVVVGERPAHEG